ncbi:MAG TPA: choice-of-anchor D domain-containing protein, partial [Terriglobales bacterium]|nr:choice-of-anchor D domain-containing protein [Terriglobales bacterium]
DGASNSATPVTVGEVPVAVVVNSATNQIYVANYSNGSVSVIDGASNSVTPVAVGISPTALAVNPATGRVYVANKNDNTVSVMEGVAVIDTVISGAGDPLAAPSAVAVNPLTNQIYVANPGRNSVTVIDGTTDFPSTFTVARELSGIALNPATNRLYVTSNYNSGQLNVFDGASNTTTNVQVGSQTRALALNPATNRIYAAGFVSNDITVIDGSDNFTTSLFVGAEPNAVAVNPITNKIYAALQEGQGVAVIDGEANSLITTVPTGNHPAAIAVNPLTNRIYVANPDNSIAVIDGASDLPIATVAVGTDPEDIAVNLVTNRIYVVNSASNNVTVIDGDTNTTIGMPIATGTTPRGVAVNPVTNRIYVSNNGSGSVTIIDGATNFSTNVVVGASPHYIAVNPVTNRIYVVNVDVPSVATIDGTTGVVISEALSGQTPSAIAINPASNKIYVANDSDMFITVIDGATGSPLTVPAASAGVSIAVNPVTNRIYVGHYFDPVTVLSEQESSPVPLVATITPLPNNQTDTSTPTFEFSAQSTYFPIAPPVDGLYFQIDTLQGKWTKATSSGLDSFSGTPAAPLIVGPHIVYAYATDGAEASSIMGGSQAGTSPATGAIAAYYFVVGRPTVATTTVLTTSLNPSSLGQPVKFTAFVLTDPSSSTIPRGSVQFYDGATLLNTTALTGTGSAMLMTASLGSGPHMISAVFVPGSGFAASTSNTINQVVGQTLMFTSANSTSFTVGINGSFNITTSGSPVPSISPVGVLPNNVTFRDNGNGTATLSGTPATGTQNTYYLSFTAHNNVSADVTQSFTLTVNPPALQSIAVTPSPASVGVGQSLQFTATGHYSDNTNVNITSTVTWQSSDSTKATINSGGLATGAAAGASNITATKGSVISPASILTVVPGLTWSPSSVNFGTVTLWGGTERIVILSNNGTSTIKFSKISLGSLMGATSKDLTLNNGCGSSLSPGKTCKLTLDLYPSKTGAVSAVISLTDNAPGSPQSIPVSATVIAPKATVSPSSLSFGNQTNHTTSAAKPVTLTNSGTGALTISSVSFSGSNASDFAVSGNTCGSSLAQGASCTISVTFTPSSKNSRSATLKITDNAQSPTQSVPLSGTGK